MAQNNVLPLLQNTKTPKQIRQTVRVTKAIRRQAGTAVAVGLAVTLAAL